MELKAHQVDGFLSKLDPSVRVLLIYGDDTGLVRERAARAAAQVIEDPDDPFRLVRLTAKDLTDDPARLGDEAAAITFGGGRRVIRVDGATNQLSDVIGGFLADPVGDALVVLEAKMLQKSGSLRKLVEKAGNAAALPCFSDDGRSLEDVIRESLAQHGLTSAPDATAYLLANLGSDRQVTRSEMDKLALYVGGRDRDPAEPVSREEAAACVAGSDGPDLDDLVFAVGSGQAAEADRVLHRLFSEGAGAIQILRGLGRHFMRLQMLEAAIAKGTPENKLPFAVRPPVYGPRARQIIGQARTWPRRAVSEAIGRINDLESTCKTTGAPDQILCARLALSLAAQGAAASRRR